MAKCPEQDCSESDGELGMSVSLTSPLMNCLPMEIILALTKRGVMSMPRKLPPQVERNHVKGHTSPIISSRQRTSRSFAERSHERRVYGGLPSRAAGPVSSGSRSVGAGPARFHRGAHCLLYEERRIHRPPGYEQDGLH